MDAVNSFVVPFVDFQSCSSSNSSYNTDFQMLQGHNNATSLNLSNGWTIPLQKEPDSFQQKGAPKEVKVKLKKAIQEKKLVNGEEIPVIEWKEPPPSQPRPPEKPEDIKLRREKNKIAAKKCRQKKRNTREAYEKKIIKLQDINSSLTLEVEKMKKEFAELSSLLQNHHCILNNTVIPMNCFASLMKLAQQSDEGPNEELNSSQLSRHGDS